MAKYTKEVTITVDDKLPTEKAYTIALTIDLSNLSEEERDAYAVRDLVVKYANDNRKKGHKHMASIGSAATFVAPKPNTRAAADPMTTLRNTQLTKEQIAELEAIIAKNTKSA